MSNLQAVPIDGGYVVKRTPGRVHGTLEKAAAEAVRLTAVNDGPAFMVLKIVGAVIGDGPCESAGTGAASSALLEAGDELLSVLDTEGSLRDEYPRVVEAFRGALNGEGQRQ